MGLAVPWAGLPTKGMIQVIEKSKRSLGSNRTGSIPAAQLQLGCQKIQSIIRTPLMSYFSCFISLFLVPGGKVFSFTAELVQQEPEHRPMILYRVPCSLSVCKGEHLYFWKAFFAITHPDPCPHPETWNSVCTAIETTANPYIFVRL